jgi:hypothetical protein
LTCSHPEEATVAANREWTPPAFLLPPIIVFGYTLTRAVVVVDGATLGLFVTE